MHTHTPSHAGKTLVIKYGGNAMIDVELKKCIMADLVSLHCAGVRLILVHGGGPDVSAAMEKAGKQPVFINGLRVTDAETMEIAEMVLSGKTNKGLVAMINCLGGKAIGLSGKDASLIFAEKTQGEVDLGFVGRITKVNPGILLDLLDHGYIPVVSSVAIGQNGEGFNTNADHAAGEIAAAVGASQLIMMTDVPGIYRDFQDKSTLISELRAEDARKMIVGGEVSKGMIPKVEACLMALGGNVETTHIIDGTVPQLLRQALTTARIGTTIVR